jgi:hypothetical protein
MRIRVWTPAGVPYRQPVALSPAGDVLPGASAQEQTTIHRVPDADGWIEVRPFASTHVRVSLPGTPWEPRGGALVPDTCDSTIVTLAER